MTWPVDGAAQTTLTLSDAIETAMDRNPNLQAARARAESAEAGASAARGAWWPRLMATESWQRSDQPVLAFGSLLSARKFTAADFSVTHLNTPGATDLFSTRLSVGQLLFDGGRTRALVAEADAHRDTARADAGDAAAQLTLTVTRTYGGIVAAQAIVRATDAAIAAAVEDLARAEHRRDAGTVTDADVLAVSVHLADMRQQRLQAGADLASARARLNGLMGVPLDEPFDVIEGPRVQTQVADLPALYAEAEAARPELQRADAEVRIAAAGVRQSGSVWWPAISAQAGIEWNGTSLSGRSRAWIVGGEARWSLSLSGADLARTRAAAAARAAATASLEGKRTAVRVDVFSAVRQMEAAAARVMVGADAVAQARERARVVRNRYDAGVASMTDVLAAESATLAAEARRIAAAVDALVANAELNRALGRAAGM